MNKPVARISGPNELVRSVPHLLGFYPVESVVMLGLDEGNQLVVTARYDLGLDQAEHTLASFERNGVTAVIVAVYTESVRPETAQALKSAAGEAGIEVRDTLHVARGFWRSLDCTNPSCCPAEGHPITDEVSEFEMMSAVLGSAPLLTRDELAVQFAPDQVISGAQLRAALTMPPLSAEEVLAHVQAAEWGDNELARIGVALSHISIRDAIWLHVDRNQDHGRELWATLARRMPAPHNAPACFIAAWHAWRAGDGALSNVALDRCFESDPTYSAAHLLVATLSSGVNPTTFPALTV